MHEPREFWSDAPYCCGALVTTCEALVPCVVATTLGGTPIVALTADTIIKKGTSIFFCDNINNCPILAHQG